MRLIDKGDIVDIRVVSDLELPGHIDNARNGDDDAMFFAVMGLLERGRKAEARALTIDLYRAGPSEGCNRIISEFFNRTGPDADPELTLLPSDFAHEALTMEPEEDKSAKLEGYLKKARKGNAHAIGMAFMYYLDDKSLEDAISLATELEGLGYTDGFGIIASSVFSEDGSAPDEARCLEFAMKHVFSDRPSSWYSAIMAGAIYARQGQLEKAQPLLERAASIDDAQNAEAWARLYFIHMLPGPNKNTIAAAKCLVKLISAEGDIPDDVEELPVYYKDGWESRKHFNAFMEAVPTEERAEVARVLLDGGILVPWVGNHGRVGQYD